MSFFILVVTSRVCHDNVLFYIGGDHIVSFLEKSVKCQTVLCRGGAAVRITTPLLCFQFFCHVFLVTLEEGGLHIVSAY